MISITHHGFGVPCDLSSGLDNDHFELCSGLDTAVASDIPGDRR